MNFQEPEVMELGEARELIQTSFYPRDEEGPVGARMKNESPIYLAEE